MHKGSEFKQGIVDGIPICLGYLSVSFAFGMMAQLMGLPSIMAVFISMTNLTSAGQFAGVKLIIAQGALIEIAITTLIINLRYMLMSLGLTQKFEFEMKLSTRCFLAFGITDEIYAVAMNRKQAVSSSYFFGLIFTPYFGWAIGTFIGVTLSALVPQLLAASLQIALYGMFLAIIVPASKKHKPITITVILAASLSCLFYYCPGLNQISSGWALIVITLFVSGVVAYLYPTSDKENSHGN